MNDETVRGLRLLVWAEVGMALANRDLSMLAHGTDEEIKEAARLARHWEFERDKALDVLRGADDARVVLNPGGPRLPVRVYAIAPTTGLHTYRMSDGTLDLFTEEQAMKLNPSVAGGASNGREHEDELTPQDRAAVARAMATFHARRAELEAEKGSAPVVQRPALDWISFVIRDIAEIPDRSSPDEGPEFLIVTGEELREIIESNLSMYVIEPVDIDAEDRRALGLEPKMAHPTPLDPELMNRAAAAANEEFGQWMPQAWLDLFRINYATACAPKGARQHGEGCVTPMTGDPQDCTCRGEPSEVSRP